MRVDNENKLILLVDIDDFLVRSSPVLQKMVDEKTNFKTEVLQMLEQLKRNCSFMIDEVSKECDKAKNENRRPDLARFKIFTGMTCEKEKWYTEPVDYAKYYYWVADQLWNHFLEERDTFLETDNMHKGEGKYFDGDSELRQTIFFSELIHKNLAKFHIINEYCLVRASELVNEAVEQNSKNPGKLTVPKYGALVTMDTNDIIKNNALVNRDDPEYRKYILYVKPIEIIVKCLENENRMHDIITNASIFSKPISNEIVDYYAIHSMENVNMDAAMFIRRLINEEVVSEVHFSTHHNGVREDGAKKLLTSEVLPEVPRENFIGQRFHDEEHNANRRGRSSKIMKAAHTLGVSPTQLVLIDDSISNCKDCVEHEALPILFKPETDAEIINGKIANVGYNRILDFSDDSFEFVRELCQKQKVKCKK